MAYVMRVSDWSSDVCSSDLRSGNRISESSRSSLSVSQAVEALSAATRNDAPAVVASLLDRLDADGRYALLKLALGGMRVLGRASCRERVCQYVYISVVALALNQKTIPNNYIYLIFII